MPKFPKSFGRRRSTADNLDNAAVAEPTFRVLERSDVANGKSFDGGARMAAKGHTLARASVSNLSIEDNLFANLNGNRGSGSSNTTKTMSTDNSSRYSNASTAPSSADLNGQEESRGAVKRSATDSPSVPKSGSSTFLKAAGRTFSFGGQKKHNHPPPVAEEVTPPVPATPSSYVEGGRARATTESTTSTATPPRLEQDFNLDLGGDFSTMLSFDKRQSVMTLRADDSTGRQALAPRTLTGNRLNQPTPLQIDKASRIDPSPFSWGSHHSNDQLLNASSAYGSPTNENAPPVPRHASPIVERPQAPTSASEGGILKRASAVMGRRRSTAEEGEADDEDSRLLKDMSAATRFLANGTPPIPSQPGRYRRNEDTLPSASSWRQVPLESRVTGSIPATEDDNLFDARSFPNRSTPQGPIVRKPAPSSQSQQHKVMTPAEFERYRQDKEWQRARADIASEQTDDHDDEEDNYEDDEDETEKSKQAAKQRRKQEAHMAVYRQQMMKVTGENASGPPASRPSMQMSYSTPNLLSTGARTGPSPKDTSDGSDEDEEVPLAILAAHGFPNRNRPPTRLATMMSNPNLRETAQTPSYQRPGSAMGDGPANNGGGRLPAFARRLPQDPFLGAGLVNSSVRESLAFGAGAPAPGQQSSGAAPPGGLVGVIANEERSRALRRGSPNIDANKPLPSMGPQQFDPTAGIPPQMMYPQMQGMGIPTMLSPGDQAQMQMNQQMQQFMQMQMQFMQMMTNNNGQGGPARPMSHMPTGSMSSMGPPMGPPMGGMAGLGPAGGPDTMRHSFMDSGSVADMPMSRPNMEYNRTMSMVQPSSSSWIQPSGHTGFAPSIRVVGASGYAPSIAPSERSNVGLPGRYRPVSQAGPGPTVDHSRKSSLLSMSGALGAWDQPRKPSPTSQLSKTAANASDDDDDDEQGWAAMKAKREQKRSMWRTKKEVDSSIGALIS